MTDWIEHTTGTCPVDPDTVVEVRLRGVYVRPADKAGDIDWGSFLKASGRPPLGSPILHPLDVTHYRIITPAPTPPLFLCGDPVKPPEPEMTKTHEDYTGPTFGVPPKPEPDLITLRLECLKLAVAQTIQFGLSEKKGHGYLAIEELSDEYLHYVLNGSVDKA